MADCGIHALHMACFVTGQEVASLSADFVSCVDGRTLEDDAMVSFRMTGGCSGRLWTSAVAVGRMHGLNIQVFGEKGGLRWAQEWPNQLFWTALNAPTQILERGAPDLSPEADRASRVTIGHAEGFSLAFANIYRDLAEVIAAGRDGRDPDPAATHVPTSRDGLNSVAAVYAAVESAKNGSAWTQVGATTVRDV
jgi:predicted dehydrogenase